VASTSSIAELGHVYAGKFDNLDEVAHVSILYRPEFANLMQKAINRNSPLTRQEIEEVFGDPGWEW